MIVSTFLRFTSHGLQDPQPTGRDNQPLSELQKQNLPPVFINDLSAIYSDEVLKQRSQPDNTRQAPLSSRDPEAAGTSPVSATQNP